jgi:hypothetical protein
VGAEAKLPRLGSQETRLDVWRIGGKYRDEEDKEEEDHEKDADEAPKEPVRATAYHYNYVWRFSTQVRDGSLPRWRLLSAAAIQAMSLERAEVD